MSLPFDHSPIIERPVIALPGDARVAVYVAVNVEHYPPGRPSTSLFANTASLDPDPLNHGWRDYGPRVGIWRLMDALDAHAIRASAAINAACCTEHPAIVREGRARGWTWIAHGSDNATLHTGLEEDDERARLVAIAQAITDATGAAPRGWLGPALTETAATPRLLEELGLDYVLDWCNDDVPYRLDTPGRRMLAVPYASELNDIPMILLRGLEGAAFAEAIIDAFEQLYDEGTARPRVLAIGVHPFLIGQPFRIGHLKRALAHIAAREQVWLTTSDELADWYAARLPVDRSGTTRIQ